MTVLAIGAVGAEVLRGVTDFGGNTMLVRVLLLATAYLLIRKRPRLAGFVAVTASGALAYHWLDLNFPSVQAVASVVAYGVLLLVFLPAVAPRWRIPTAVTSALLVVVMDVLRVLFGGPLFGAVVAGWLLGLVGGDRRGVPPADRRRPVEFCDHAAGPRPGRSGPAGRTG